MDKNRILLVFLWSSSDPSVSTVFGNKQVLKADGTAVNVSVFASRAYLKGTTPYNNYTPEGGFEDKINFADHRLSNSIWNKQ